MCSSELVHRPYTGGNIQTGVTTKWDGNIVDRCCKQVFLESIMKIELGTYSAGTETSGDPFTVAIS